MTTVAIVYHSGYGHTAALARHVAEGVAAAGATPELLVVESPTQDFTPFHDRITKADAVIFGAPTYMGDVSATFKAFEESTSALFGSRAWRDKLAAGFTNSHSFAGDKQHALQSLATFASQHSMLWLSLGEAPPAVTARERGADTVNISGFFLGLAGQSDNAAVEQSQSPGEHETARRFGKRVAEAAARWSAGKAAVEHRVLEAA